MNVLTAITELRRQRGRAQGPLVVFKNRKRLLGENISKKIEKNLAIVVTAQEGRDEHNSYPPDSTERKIRPPTSQYPKETMKRSGNRSSPVTPEEKRRRSWLPRCCVKDGLCIPFKKNGRRGQRYDVQGRGGRGALMRWGASQRKKRDAQNRSRRTKGGAKRSTVKGVGTIPRADSGRTEGARSTRLTISRKKKTGPKRGEGRSVALLKE